MKSLNTYNPARTAKAGFTLMEVIVVLGMLSIIAAAGMVFSFDSYRGYLFRAEYGNVAHVIVKARNLAANNFNEAPHGVHFEANSYTLFVGNSYDSSNPSNQVFERNAAITYAYPTDIVFEQLSGNLLSCSTDPCTLSFSYGSLNKDITINDFGGITW